jgi:uncharacterized protein (DUF302 family)
VWLDMALACAKKWITGIVRTPFKITQKQAAVMRHFMLIGLLLLTSLARAADEPVFSHSIHKPMNDVYDWVYKELEQQGFYVVFEANIGKNLSNFAEKWGADYNQNKLDGIRSLVFCHGWYANLVSNADPTMLALCPLHITLIEKNGTTTALFVRPSLIASKSPAHDVLLQVEAKVTAAIKQAMPIP